MVEIKTMNTANCYVVDAPGYYSFPLVYGNSIKDGNDNVQSYSYTGPTGRNMLRVLLNHASSITSHYIQNGRKSHQRAELLGQDASNLITEVKYNENNVCSTISFKVDKMYHPGRECHYCHKTTHKRKVLMVVAYLGDWRGS